MRKSVIWAVVASSAVAATVVTVFLICQGSSEKNTSAESLSFFSSHVYRDSNHKFDWIEEAIGSPAKSSVHEFFTCPKSATEVFSFLSSRGGERDTHGGWKAYSPTAFYFGTSKVLEPNLRISGLIYGSPGPRYIKDTGGDFSLGIACTSGNLEKVLKVSYRFISIEARSGSWVALPEPSIKAH